MAISMELPASVLRVTAIAQHIARADGGLTNEDAYELAVIAQDAVEATFGNVLDPQDAWERVK